MTAAAPALIAPLAARVGVGIVGYGNWGEKLARAFARVRRADIAAVCDLCPAARDRARVLGAPLTRRFEELLERPDTRALVIATPPATHATLALAALEAGLDVLVEKPMTLRLEDALLLERTACDRDRVLMVGHILEYHPALIELARRIRNGELGAVRLVFSERLGASARRHENAWWSLAPHDVSVVRMLLGEEPTRVSVRGSGENDAVSARLELEGGALALAELSMVASRKVRRIAVLGSDRVAVFDDLDPSRQLRLFEPDAIGRARLAELLGAAREHDLSRTEGLDAFRIERWLPASGGQLVPVAAAEPLLVEAEHFVAGVLDRAPFPSDGASGRQVVAVLAAGALSLERHGAESEVPAHADLI